MILFAGTAFAGTFELSRSDVFTEMYKNGFEAACAASSFMGAAAWRDASEPDAALAAACAGNDYVVGAGVELMTPTNKNTTLTFPGDSLAVADGGRATFITAPPNGKGATTFTVPIRLSGGGVLAVLAGENGNVTFDAPLHVEMAPDASATLVYTNAGTKLATSYQHNDMTIAFQKLSGGGVLNLLHDVTSCGAQMFHRSGGFNAGARFQFGDLTEWNGAFVLRGLPISESAGNSHKWHQAGLVVNSVLAASKAPITLAGNASLLFNTATPIETPLCIPAGTDTNFFIQARSSAGSMVTLAADVTGGGSVYLIGNRKNAEDDRLQKFKLSNLTWEGGAITVMNAELEIDNVFFPHGGTLMTRDMDGMSCEGGIPTAPEGMGEGVISRVSLAAFLDDEYPVTQDWRAGNLLTFTPDVTVHTRRSAPLLTGTHRLAQLPADAEIGMFGTLTVEGPYYQASWLKPPVWTVEDEDGARWLKVTLEEKGEYVAQTVKHEYDMSKTWKTAATWGDYAEGMDNPSPRAGVNYESSMKPFHSPSTSARFPGDSMTIRTGGTYYISQTATIDYLYLEGGTLVCPGRTGPRVSAGKACTILGTEQTPTQFSCNNSRARMFHEIPLVGKTNACLEIVYIDVQNDAPGQVILPTENPDYRGTVRLSRTLSKDYNVSMSVVVTNELALGAPPPVFNAKALHASGAHVRLSTFKDLPLTIAEPTRGVTLGAGAELCADGADAVLTLASATHLASGKVYNLGEGRLTVGGTATAAAGAAFHHCDGVFQPLVGDCFSAAALCVTTNCVATNRVSNSTNVYRETERGGAVRITPGAGDATLRAEGLVNTAGVTCTHAFDLVLDVPAAVRGQKIWRVPVLTAPSVAEFKAKAELTVVGGEQLDARDLSLIDRPSETRPGLRTLFVQYGTNGTVLLFR